MSSLPEVWLRGPLADIPSALQPAAHAVLQAQEEIHELMRDFSDDLLWRRPMEMASPGFHLQHIVGVLDRMISYADALMLTEEQFDYLRKEGLPSAYLTTKILLEKLDQQIEQFLQHLSKTDPSTLSDYRGVGRSKLPSTVGGTLFHAAEHTQRHLGQLLVTVKVVLGT